MTSASEIEQCRAQLVDLLIAEPHVTGRQLDPSLGGTVRLLSPADPQANATDVPFDADEHMGFVPQGILASEQQQRGWLVAQRLPALQLADLLRCELVGNIAPGCGGHGGKATPPKIARTEQLSRLTLGVAVSPMQLAGTEAQRDVSPILR